MALNYTYHKGNENPLGGGDFLIDIWSKAGLNELITSHLGRRSPRAEYTYAEGILSLFISQMRGNRRIESLYEARPHLKAHPRFNSGMSPDTALYMFKELAVPKKQVPIEHKFKKDQRRSRKKPYHNHEVIISNDGNELLIAGAIALQHIDPKNEVGYILDFDATELTTKIADARRTYKHNGKRGYCPNVGFINNIPIYIENRNGNTNAAFDLINSVKGALDLARSKGIKIHTVRLDSAAFIKEFVSFCNAYGVKYYVRAKRNTVKAQVTKIRNWNKAMLNGQETLMGDTTFFFGKEETRLVAKKLSRPMVDQEGKKREEWGVITNNYNVPNEEVLESYAQRGESEHLFRGLKSFGWDILPTRKIEFNTVFLYITAFNYSVFKYAAKYISKILPDKVSENMQLATFIRVFMRIATKWVGNKLSVPEHAKEYIRLMSGP